MSKQTGIPAGLTDPIKIGRFPSFEIYRHTIYVESVRHNCDFKMWQFLRVGGKDNL